MRFLGKKQQKINTTARDKPVGGSVLVSRNHAANNTRFPAGSFIAFSTASF